MFLFMEPRGFCGRLCSLRSADNSIHCALFGDYSDLDYPKDCPDAKKLLSLQSEIIRVSLCGAKFD